MRSADRGSGVEGCGVELFKHGRRERSPCSQRVQVASFLSSFRQSVSIRHSKTASRLHPCSSGGHVLPCPGSMEGGGPGDERVTDDGEGGDGDGVSDVFHFAGYIHPSTPTV